MFVLNFLKNQFSVIVLKDHYPELFVFFLRSSELINYHLFYYFMFTFLICVFSTFLILANNPIYSVIRLILVYLSASFLLVCIDVHFLAVLFILVYLGAVVVLFLFIVMMLNIKILTPLNVFSFIPFLILFILLFIILSGLNNGFMPGFVFVDDLKLKNVRLIDFFSLFSFGKLFYSDIYSLESLNYKFEHQNLLAFLLYSHYFIELILASYILLLAMVGCIALTLGQEFNFLKKQDTMKQVLSHNAFIIRGLRINDLNVN